MRLVLPIDLTRRGANAIVGGINDSSIAQLPPLTQGDTVTFALQGLRPYLTYPSPSIYYEDRISFTTLRLGIGLIDAPPKSGTFALEVDGDATADLEWNVAPEVMAAALNELPSVIALGGVTVTRGKATHFYLIRWNDPEVTQAVEVVSNRLSPRCFPRVLAYEDAAENFQLIKLIQAPLAYSDSFAYPDPPEIEISRVRSGSSLRNELQSIFIPATANGEFELQFATFSTVAISISGVTAAIIGAALAELYADSTERFRIKELTTATGRLFQVEFVGPFAKAAQNLLGFAMYSQVPLPYPEATLTIPALPLDLILDGSAATAMGLEIVTADGAGHEDTLAQRTVTILNDMLDGAVAETIAAIATKTETVYVTLDPEADAIIIGQRGVQVNHPGYATPTAGSGSSVNITHNLGTRQPLIAVSQLVSLSPEQWRTGHLAWNASNTDADSSTIYLGFQPPEPGELGSVKFTIINPQAAPYVNDHTHPLTAVYRASDDKPLNEILDELAASLPTGWPTIPGNKIENNSITGDKIDIASLVAQLLLSSAFTSAFSTLLNTGTVLDTLVTSLLDSNTFLTSLAANNTFTTALTANATFISNLLNSPSFVTVMQGMFLDTIQGTALGSGIVIALPDIDASYPEKIDADTFAPLPAVQISPTDLGSITGYVPKASASNAGKRYTVATVAHLPPNRRKTFRDGVTIFSDGADWWEGTLSGTEMFAAEFDRSLFTVPVNELMLSLGTRFALNFGFSLQLLGANCEALYLFELRRGTYTSETVSPVNLEDITWDETIISQPLILSDAAVTHVFGYSVTRTTGDVLSATKTRYLATASATTPSAPKFILQARLIQFDVRNVEAPRGQVRLIMKSASASIAKLTT